MGRAMTNAATSAPGDQGTVDFAALLGPRRGLVAVGAALLGVIYLMFGLLSGGIESYPLYVAVFVLYGVGAAALLVERGDPLSVRSTAIAAGATSAGIIVALWAVAGDGRQAGLMAGGGCAMLLAFLCLRGRTGAAWLCFGAAIVVFFAVEVARGRHPGVESGYQGAMGVLVMITVFARTVRPRARQVMSLRRQRSNLALARQMQEAVARQRQEQLTRLDERARPLLEAIAAGGTLTEDQVRDSRLTEAQLRDRIRAPHLDVPAVADAAWAARRRGVRVLLLDDRPEDADEVLPTGSLLAEAVRVIERAKRGDEVTVRLLPPGRARLGTIAVGGVGGHRLTEFAGDGRAIST